MKIIYLFWSLLCFKITDAFRVIFEKYRLLSQHAHGIIKSVSGTFSLNKSFFNMITSKSQMQMQSVIPSDCDVNTKICNKDIIIPGYMEHDPKNAALKKIN
jgi:hypothetical protein